MAAESNREPVGVETRLQNDPLYRLAQELFWWQTPDHSLADPRRFLAQVMALGTWQEVQTIRAAYEPEALKDAVVHAPAGIFDARSWTYWRAVFGLPEAELPRRSLT